MVTLVIAERRLVVWPVLQEVFDSVEGVDLCRDDPGTFVRRPDLDAMILGRWPAHERYVHGKGLPVGISCVLSTEGDIDAPPWVVTTPGFRAHLAFDETGELLVVQDHPPSSPGEEAYIVFSKVFQAVQRFNEAAGDHPKLHRLGCDLEFTGIACASTTPDIRGEMVNILRAYRETTIP